MFRHLHKDGRSVILSINWRFIICTPRQAGKQGNQSLQNPAKINLKQKENYLAIKKFNQLFKPANLWVGVFCLVFLASSLFSNTKKVQAASVSENLPAGEVGLEYARRIVSEAAISASSLPVVSNADLPVSTPDGFIAKPLVVETNITPDINQSARKTNILKTAAKTSAVKVKLSSDGGNHFSYGYCTYYVASRRNIPWSGNAGTWLTGARAAGFATGETPQVGAIIVTSESAYGHVGIVEAVNGDGTIMISEMNYSGFARITSRTISTSYGAIKGYIY